MDVWEKKFVDIFIGFEGRTLRPGFDNVEIEVEQYWAIYLMYDPWGDGIALFGRTCKTQFEHVRVQLFFLPLDSRKRTSL